MYPFLLTLRRWFSFWRALYSFRVTVSASDTFIGHRCFYQATDCTSIYALFPFQWWIRDTSGIVPIYDLMFQLRGVRFLLFRHLELLLCSFTYILISIRHFKINLCIAGKKTKIINHTTTKAHVFLSEIISQLTAIVTYAMNDLQYIQSLKSFAI